MSDTVQIPRCPHCQKPLRPLRFGAVFGPLGVEIIDAIADAGPEGVDIMALFNTVYRNRPGATLARLRSYIGRINEQLAGADSTVAISACQQRYRIIARRRA